MFVFVTIVQHHTISREDCGRDESMEQPAFFSIVRTDFNYRFRLDLPDGSVTGLEYNTDLSVETAERLRRALQAASQSMYSLVSGDVKRQTTKLSVVTDSLLALGRFLFDIMLPNPLQEAL